MKNKLVIFIILLSLTTLGGFLRFYGNTHIPPGLNIDEVAIGYNAYSILKTGRDENGEFLPITFASYGDYKNPLAIYLLVPIIPIFGLNDFSVRFLSAFFGTLTIPLIFFFFKYLTKNIRFGLMGSFILTISSWHIFYSRLLYENLIATFLIVLGVWFLLKTIEGSKIAGLWSALFFVLSLYTYYAERLFIPVFAAIVILFNFKKIKNNIGGWSLFFTTGIFLSIPLINVTFFGKAASRASAIILSKDIDFIRYVHLDHLDKSGEILLLLFYWIQRYLNYFQPDFIFFNGLNMTQTGTLGLGLFYLFQLPFLLLGIWQLVGKNLPYKHIIIVWILLGLIPASLTIDQRNPGRFIMIIPALIFIITLGLEFSIEYFKKIRAFYLKVGLILLLISFMVVEIIGSFLVFNVHFPRDRGEYYMEGTKQSVEYALAHKHLYKEIVFDPYRGIEGPYIVNVPHEYILFYSAFEPLLYQTIQKRIGETESLYGFDKFTIRRINWIEDKSKKDVLFIGSPWDFTGVNFKDGELLQEIKMINGHTALEIVTPK